MRLYPLLVAGLVSTHLPLFAQEPLTTMETASATNPIADPFAANVRRVEPPVPLNRPNAGDFPVPSFAVFPVLPAALPQGLRVAMIRSGGYGLLALKEPGSNLIPVKHKGTVRLGGQTYHAEVDDDEIRLMSGPKGKPLWIGTLDGSLSSGPTSNASQGHFEPPLSAGVNPGLKSSHSNSGNSNSSPTTKP